MDTADKTVFELEYPVKVNGVDYTELAARRPKVKDLRLLTQGADKDPVGAFNKFLASLCTVPPAVFDELDLMDHKKIQGWANDFLKSDET